MSDFIYKESDYNWREEFPKIGLELFLQSKLSKLKDNNNHKTIINVLNELLNGSFNYHWFYENFSEKPFEGKCYQISPVFGLYLSALGFDASFLECYQVKERNSWEPETPEKKFKKIGYNPYCLIEVSFWNEKFLISPKHFNQGLVSLLQSDSHRDLIGIIAHPEDPDKSGIYLKNLNKAGKEHIWFKKDYKSENEEYFRTFLKARISI